MLHWLQILFHASEKSQTLIYYFFLRVTDDSLLFTPVFKKTVKIRGYAGREKLFTIPITKTINPITKTIGLPYSSAPKITPSQSIGSHIPTSRTPPAALIHGLYGPLLPNLSGTEPVTNMYAAAIVPKIPNMIYNGF